MPASRPGETRRVSRIAHPSSARCASSSRPRSARSRSPYSRTVSSIRYRPDPGLRSANASRDWSTSSVSTAEASASRSRPADSSVKPSGNTASIASASAAAGERRRRLHSMTASSVRCRSGAVRSPPISTAKRSARRRSSSVSVIHRRRAAASSIASGRPSSRAQEPLDKRASSATPGRAAVARTTKSAGSAVAAGSGWGATTASRHEQRHPARGEDREGGHRREQVVRERGHRVHDVLAVVEHEQGAPAREHLAGARRRSGGRVVQPAGPLQRSGATAAPTTSSTSIGACAPTSSVNTIRSNRSARRVAARARAGSCPDRGSR